MESVFELMSEDREMKNLTAGVVAGLVATGVLSALMVMARTTFRSSRKCDQHVF